MAAKAIPSKEIHMKISDIAAKYNIDATSFTGFLNRQGIIKISGMFSPSIADEDVPVAVESYKQWLSQKDDLEQRKKEEWAAHLEAERKQQEEKEKAAILAEQERFKREQEKQEAVAKILISSGFNFEGYRIVKYSGYISGDDAVEIPRTFTIFGLSGGDNGQKLTDALVKIRIQALKELKEAAYDLGCNAVIGVDFDYITLEPETADIVGKTVYQPYIICVTANGNAVVIEKV